MDLAVFAGWLGILGTAFETIDGIVQQVLAVIAQLAFGSFVFAPAVDIYEIPQYVTVFFLLVHAIYFPRDWIGSWVKVFSNLKASVPFPNFGMVDFSFELR